MDANSLDARVHGKHKSRKNILDGGTGFWSAKRTRGAGHNLDRSPRTHSTVLKACLQVLRVDTPIFVTLLGVPGDSLGYVLLFEVSIYGRRMLWRVEMYTSEDESHTDISHSQRCRRRILGYEWSLVGPSHLYVTLSIEHA